MYCSHIFQLVPGQQRKDDEGARTTSWPINAIAHAIWRSPSWFAIHSATRSFVKTAMEAYELPRLMPTTGGRALIVEAVKICMSRELDEIVTVNHSSHQKVCCSESETKCYWVLTRYKFNGVFSFRSPRSSD